MSVVRSHYQYKSSYEHKHSKKIIVWVRECHAWHSPHTLRIITVPIEDEEGRDYYELDTTDQRE
jgi:hypothetical protein